MNGRDYTKRRMLVGGVLAGLFNGLAASPSFAQLAAKPDGAAPPAAKPDVIQGADDPADRLTAPVTINGMGPYSFVVDTGAERSVLSVELAAQLGLPGGDPILVHGVAGQVVAVSAQVERMTVGARTVQALTLPLLARRDIGADGVLGIDALQGQLVLLDFPRRQIVVQASTPRRRTSPDEIVVRAKSRFGQLILVDSSFNDKPVLVVVDTGAEVSVANAALRRLFAISSRVEGQAGKADIFSVTGQQTTGDWKMAPRLKVGGMIISNLPVVFSDLHSFTVWRLDQQPSMLLGMDILRQFETVEIDFLHREIRFRVPRTPPPPVRLGF
jgi:predicted aspartyl protease